MTAREFTSSELVERTIHRRAFEAVIWGMPVVNFDLMYQAAAQLKATFNQIVYWSRLPDWKNQTLTPNPDSVYLMPFYNTKDVGPIVVEIPPADDGTIVGSLMDCWQVPLEDVGPAGVDQGKGGRYLILPPDYKEEPPDGFLALASDTFQGYGLLRSILKRSTDKDVAQAVAYAKRIKVYPLSEASNPPATVFVDAIGMLFDSTIRYDLPFFRSLNRMVQYEPWQTRDKVMIDLLKSIGIEKGKPFNPDSKTQGLLRNAILEAHSYMDLRYEEVFQPPFMKEQIGRCQLPRNSSLGSNHSIPSTIAIPSMPEGYCFPMFFSAPSIWERASFIS